MKIYEGALKKAGKNNQEGKNAIQKSVKMVSEKAMKREERQRRKNICIIGVPGEVKAKH